MKQPISAVYRALTMILVRVRSSTLTSVISLLFVPTFRSISLDEINIFVLSAGYLNVSVISVTGDNKQRLSWNINGTVPRNRVSLLMRSRSIRDRSPICLLGSFVFAAASDYAELDLSAKDPVQPENRKFSSTFLPLSIIRKDRGGLLFCNLQSSSLYRASFGGSVRMVLPINPINLSRGAPCAACAAPT